MKQAPSFWSRRRAAVQAEEEAERRAEEAANEQARAEALAEKGDAEILSEMGLPDPEAMQQGDNFAAFMSRDVPEHLRRRALRTLWRSNPVLACVDGLNDYDDDYHAAMLAQKPFKTAYQVGKGMMAHIEEMERQAREASAEGVDAVCEESPAEETVALVEAAPQEVETTPTKSETDVEDEEDHTPAPRRMRFHFEEASL